MSRDHLAFALFMLLLLVAPKVPLQISGGVADSSLSLGFAGLVLWLLAHPERLWHIPKISDAHPLFWLGTFALYAFLVSAISTKSVGIAYSLQYSFYIVIGSVLMVRYARESSLEWLGRLLFDSDCGWCHLCPGDVRFDWHGANLPAFT